MSNLKLKANPTNHAEAMEALAGKRERTIGPNTKLFLSDDGSVYANYHGNTIVEYKKDRTLASWAGWVTATTALRLNRLTGGRFNIRQFEPYVNGEPVGSSDWISV